MGRSGEFGECVQWVGEEGEAFLISGGIFGMVREGPPEQLVLEVS